MGCIARLRGHLVLGRAMRLLRRLLPVVAIIVLCAVLPSVGGDPHKAQGPGASPAAQLGQLITPVAIGLLAVVFGVFELGVLLVGSGTARRGAAHERTAGRRYEGGCGKAERKRIWPGG